MYALAIKRKVLNVRRHTPMSPSSWLRGNGTRRPWLDYILQQRALQSLVSIDRSRRGKSTHRFDCGVFEIGHMSIESEMKAIPQMARRTSCVHE